MTKESISVEGMTCGHCKMTVENKTASLDGVVSSKVNLKKKNVTLKFDESKVTRDTIAAAITEAGYQVV
jgi:copper chaperone